MGQHRIVMLIVIPLLETYWICCQHCSGVHTPVGVSNTLHTSTYLCRNYIHLLKQVCFLRSQQQYASGHVVAVKMTRGGTGTERNCFRSFIINKNNSTLCIVYILLGISPASNCSWPTFRNPVSVPSSKAGCRL